MSGRLIRKATPADQPRIHAIRMGVSENVLSDPSRVTDEEVAWYREKAVFLVSEEAGVVAGFTCANHQTGLVWALFVDPVHEGCGHGKALLEAALDTLRAAGIVQAHLTTAGGTRAEGFYRRQGWQETGVSLDGNVVFIKPLG